MVLRRFWVFILGVLRKLGAGHQLLKSTLYNVGFIVTSKAEVLGTSHGHPGMGPTAV